MNLWKTGQQAMLLTLLGASIWLSCSPSDDRNAGDGPVATAALAVDPDPGACLEANGQPKPDTTRCDDGNPATYGDHCALGACTGSIPPAGSPAQLAPLVWYHAGAPEVSISDNGVATWFDRTSNHRNLTQSVSANRPVLSPTGWNGTKPTLTFTNDVLRYDTWTGTPNGNDTEFTILAVFQPVAGQAGTVASLWNPSGQGKVLAQLTNTGGNTVLDLYRSDNSAGQHSFPTATNLASNRHVAIWRYNPSAVRLTVDGFTTSWTPSDLGILSTTSLVVGASTYSAPSAFFSGNLSELAIVPRSISDAAVARFNTYAQNEWGGLTLCSPNCSSSLCGAPDGCGSACTCGPAPSCDLDAAFNPAEPAFTGTALANGLTFSQDGLTAFISMKSAPSSNYDIYVATRASTNSPFNAPSLLGTPNDSRDDTAPSLTADGLRLYLTKVNPAFGYSRDLAVATRSSPSTLTFNPVAWLTSLNTGLHEQDPFFLSSRSELYFAAEDQTTGIRDLYVATRSGNEQYSNLHGLSANGPSEDYRPVPTQDALTLYFSSERTGIGSDTNGDIWVAKRSSDAEPFGQPTNLYALNTSYKDFPVTLSSDGCTLYFASNRDTRPSQTDLRLYQATRHTSVLPSVTTTIHVLGAGSVNAAPFQCSTNCSAQGTPDSTLVVQASSHAYWSGSCTSNGGQPSSDGVVVFTNGGVCTVAFPGNAGTPCSPSTPCAPGHICTNGTCQCTPNCTGHCGGSDGCGGTCPTCGPGESGCDSNDDCNDGLTCEIGVCTCTPACEGRCEGSDGCGGTCKGGPGATCCQVTADCQDGLACVSGTCMNPGCLINPVATGCGYDGAPCGNSCTPNPICTSDSECPNGFVCPQGNGWRYGVPDLRVCVRPEWGCDEVHPPGGCGGPLSNCGVCDCVPQCAGKQCGAADLNDSCGGRCMGVCDPGELGCTLDVDCGAGYICRESRCRPADPCGSPTVPPSQCGPDSLCGTCPVRARFLTNGRTCGIDPNTQESLGNCPSDQFCNGAGQCAKLETTPNIFVPNADGSPREVVPQPVTPARGIGSIGGKFAVTDKGSASYTIPIELPPGGSIMPSLSLRYTSTTGNGSLGAGWSLDGLSNIARCAKIFALDGYNHAWTGAPDDALCLDGQRLVKLTDGTYRTAVDTFSKIVPTLSPTGQPETIKVYTKDGRILTYGDNYGSRAMIWNGQVGTWALSRVEDRSGNFMRVTYRAGVETPAGSAELVPHVITYTGHGQLDGDREVEFAYDQNRPDQYLRESGIPGSRTHRMTTITVRAQQQTLRSYYLTYETTLNTSRLKSIQECIAPLVCKPETTFDYMLEESRFDDGATTFVALCTGQSLCQTPINISAQGYTHWVEDTLAPGIVPGGRDWMGTAVYDTYGTRISPTLGIPSFVVSYVPLVGPFASAMISMLGTMLDSEETVLNLYDVNPSGRQVTSTAYTCPTPGTLYAISEDPAEGDGERVGMHCSQFVPTGRTVEVLGAESPTFVEVAAWAAPRVWYIDVDGNGVQDNLFCDHGYLYLNLSHAAEDADAHLPSGNTQVYDARLDIPDLCRVDCAEEDLAADYSTDPPQPPRTTCSEDRPFSTVFDVDTDGTANLVFYSRLNGWFYLDYDLSDPTDAQDLYVRNDLFEGVSLSATHKNYVTTLDANGDGLRDILGLPDPKFDPNGKPVILYNSKNGFFQQTLSAQGNLGSAPTLQAFVMDYDRDGVEELVEPTSLHQEPTELPHSWRIRRIQDGRILGEQADLTGGPGTLGDFDGDGTVDAYTRAVSNPLVFHRGRGRHNGLLNRVTDGLGHRVDIVYDDPVAPQSDGSFSDLDINFDSSLCEWPIRCPSRVPHALVTTHSESHYTDQAPHDEAARVLESTSTYEYGRWISEMTGYGAFGFTNRKITVTDASARRLSQTKIDYELPVPGPRAVPYTYPTAGLVKQLIHEGPLLGSRISTSYTPKELTTRHWVTQYSDAAVAFPVLQSETTQRGMTSSYFEFPNQGAPISFTGLTALTTTSVFNFVDAWGNVEDQLIEEADVDGFFPNQTVIAGSESFTTMHRTFERAQEWRNAWLIGLVKTESVTNIPRCGASDCESLTRTRRHEFEYYPVTSAEGPGLLRRVHRQNGDTALEQHVLLERNQRGNVWATTKTDASGNERRTEIVFDARDLFPIAATVVGGQARHTTQVRYNDRFGLLTSRADPNGIDETWSYDELGIERHHHGPEGERTRIYSSIPAYTSDLGLPIQAATRFVTTETGGNVITEDYNSFGQPVRYSTTAFQDTQVSQEWVYDERQRLVQQSRPHREGVATQGYLSFEYDLLDRVVAQTNPDGRRVLWDMAPAAAVNGVFLFDAPGAGAIDVTRTTDANMNATVKVTNRSGLPVWMFDAAEGTTFFYYEGFNVLRRVIAAHGETDINTVAFNHDDFGRLIEIDDLQRGGPEHITHNGLDEVVETLDNAARVTKTFYDSFGRVDHIEDDENGDGISDGITQFTYDGDGTQPNTIGRLVETVSPSGQRVTYGYESRKNGYNRGFPDRITRHLTALGVGPGSGDPRVLETLVTYNANSRISRIDYPIGAEGKRISVEYGYDSRGRNVRVADATTPANIYWELLETDPEQGSRIHKERIGNAPCGGTLGAITTREYDAAHGAPESIATACGATTIQHLTYTYDPGGNLQSRSDLIGGGIESFGHDPENRLISVNQSTFEYSFAIGKLTSQTGVGDYTYDTHSPAWLRSAGEMFYYRPDDAVGNITYRSGPAINGDIQTIEYTPFDLPRAITNSVATPLITNFLYDASGRRAVKQRVDYAQFYAGDLFQRRETFDGTTHRAMIYAGGRAVAQVTEHETSSGTTTETRYLHDDNLGSIQTISTESGVLESMRRYSPFGRKEVSGSSDVPYGFTGHEEDDELGLINMKGRMYDPYAGQFLTADPIIQSPYGTGLNRFAYVRNSPMNYVDPSGFEGVLRDVDTFYGQDVAFFDDPLTGTPPTSAGPSVNWTYSGATAPADGAVVGAGEILSTGASGLGTLASATYAVVQMYGPSNTHQTAAAPTQVRGSIASDSARSPSTTMENPIAPDGVDGARTTVNSDWGSPESYDDVPQGPATSQQPVENKLLSDFSSQVPDTSGSLEKEFVAITAIPDVAMLAAAGGRFLFKEGLEALAARGIAKLPVPKTPGGMKLPEFGKLMNWGTGHEAARSQIPSLTREGLQKSGVTREIAESWGQFYRNEALRNPANPSALGRAELMEAAANLLR